LWTWISRSTGAVLNSLISWLDTLSNQTQTRTFHFSVFPLVAWAFTWECGIDGLPQGLLPFSLYFLYLCL
jgi:hypothetical protein